MAQSHFPVNNAAIAGQARRETAVVSHGVSGEAVLAKAPEAQERVPEAVCVPATEAKRVLVT
ncbi:hypothetical protein HRR83_007222 [Exophiala dermatitidis]|nr:hypothetical protein HRR73_006514 [Exophiala dermatitidis]KAJ4550907.1 hypothetical protein HRR77_003262 [Exophiala dermatitidis]KAJ4591921.1 hypothetical protein HRR83_007222 [Exophiala dermatitidis]KAJ4617476.1 hypothetical protein HRR85_002475 [Exophiala dermatitidis]KAJ4622342.1 hypothetical protein HRR86_005978 [Exophiala dermatitidis]